MPPISPPGHYGLSRPPPRCVDTPEGRLCHLDNPQNADWVSLTRPDGSSEYISYQNNKVVEWGQFGAEGSDQADKIELLMGKDKEVSRHEAQKRLSILMSYANQGSRREFR